MANFLKKLFGSSNEAEIKRLRKILDKVNALEPKMHALRDEELRALTPAFKDRLQKGETLDDLLPEAFAAWPGELVELNLAKGTGRGLWRVRESVCGLTAAGTYTRLTLGEP